METAKEKAKDIYVKMLETITDDIIQDNWQANELAKLHSSICVDEIINHLTSNEVCFKNHIEPIGNYKFWAEVKTEINNL